MKISHSVLTALAGIAILPLAANAGLVAWYPLDTDANDASGNGHNGSVVGGTVNFGQGGANGATGASASFPDNGHIDVPFSSTLNPGSQAPDGSGSFTWTVWTNATSLGGFNSPLTAREDNGASVNGPIIYNTPAEAWTFWSGNNGPSGAWHTMDDGNGTVDLWTHVAITYDEATTTKKLWIDGELAIEAVQGISANAQRDLHIGAGQDDGNNFFWNGQLDDVTIWDNALSQAEIQRVMTNSIPEPGSATLLLSALASAFVLRRRRH